jgi:hypothetical protein
MKFKDVLIILLHVFLFVFLMVAGVGFLISNDVETLPRLIIGFLLICDAFIYLLVFSQILNKKRYLIFFVLFLLINIILTLTDEVGVWDYIVLAYNLLLMIHYIFVLKK